MTEDKLTQDQRIRLEALSLASRDFGHTANFALVADVTDKYTQIIKEGKISE